MTDNGNEVVTLRSGPSILQVCPSAGGSITRYACERGGRSLEWLRPAAPADIARRFALGMSCFPLVPFSNRIRQGRFTFQGQEVQLARNFPPEPHAIHGHGWHARWEVRGVSENRLAIEYAHGADSWPFPYRARQSFFLSPDSLEITIGVINEGSRPMPVGFGLHPYFVRTPKARLMAKARKVWLSDENVMPTELVDAPDGWRLDQGISPADVVMDNNFAGWDGRAIIEWPEWDARLTLRADARLSFLVVYTPPGQDFFCAEPVSNCVDAFNLAAAARSDTGMIVLGRGERVEAGVILAVRPGGLE